VQPIAADYFPPSSLEESHEMGSDKALSTGDKSSFIWFHKKIYLELSASSGNVTESGLLNNALRDMTSCRTRGIRPERA
jgi:hypothetical protein